MTTTVYGFPVKHGCLEVGGVPLTRLAQRAGQTPFYAYERRLLNERIRHLRRLLPRSVALHYALKANRMPAVVQHLAGITDGFGVATAEEMRIALDTGISPVQVSLAGPGKTDAELAQAIAAGILVEIESAEVLRRITSLAESLSLRPQIVLRVNPNFQIRGSRMRMGGARQFGIDAAAVPALLGEVAAAGVEFRGFHIFAGSQNLNTALMPDAQEKTIELAIRLAAHAPAPVLQLNIGGGFGIPYFPEDTPLDIAPIGLALRRLIETRVKRSLPRAKVIIELGRYIVAEAGIYVARILERRVLRGHTYLVTDGGLPHQLPASDNFGQVIRRNYPAAIGNRLGASARESVSVVGRLCTPFELLAENVELARAEVGDLFVFFQSGAYNLTASAVPSLGHTPPLEILV